MQNVVFLFTWKKFKLISFKLQKRFAIEVFTTQYKVVVSKALRIVKYRIYLKIDEN